MIQTLLANYPYPPFQIGVQIGRSRRQFDCFNSASRQGGCELLGEDCTPVMDQIVEGELVAVPDVVNTALCVLVLRIPGESTLAVTALNFSQKPIQERIVLRKIEALRGFALAGRHVIDSLSGQTPQEVDSQGGLSVEIEGWSGRPSSSSRGNPAERAKGGET
jgi:hypothetical protein